MNKYLTFRKTKQTNNQQETVSMAADDVHRIALRNPALFQTKSVPRVSELTMDGPGGRGMI